MTVMDPWNSQDKETALINDNCASLTFEDNFSPSLRHSLPDSDQYLAILEEKLRKIKNDPNILRQLSEKREACMQNLLNGEAQFEESDFETPLKNSEILRALAPQKQAINKGEVVELVHYDQLANDSDSSEN